MSRDESNATEIVAVSVPVLIGIVAAALSIAAITIWAVIGSGELLP
ncbi:MAG TPA: hypothetical protein VNZ94_00325 [Xanthobacteraceae bacterium]|nr:hypothetical protein [Xanthobacteraceae bacterium]